MPKKMLIDATHAEETRVVVVDGNKVEEFDFESENRRQLAGNIYLAKVTRVEPSLQAAFVDYGGNRHGFLAFSEIHPDYYQIPVADRQALLEEERAYAEAQASKDDDEPKPKRRSRSRSRAKPKAEEAVSADAKTSAEIEGMETVDLSDEDDVEVDASEASSPMERVPETPVETPEVGSDDDASDDATLTEDSAEDKGAEADADEETDGDDAPKAADATSKDETIESVADEDDSEDIRPVRKPRPRRYKIQEVIKMRQILLVQVVKEERGNKGAALTTYLSLAGRYCVLMPNTARGGGISRKITNAADRKKLKEIANEITVPLGAGLIVRTAGAKRTRAEIKRDYEYLQRLWEQIRELTLKSIAPAKIYEEGDLIKRSIRDLYNRDIDEVFVEGERGYRIAKDFMKMIMPSHAKNVKRYEENLPLFARYKVEDYLSGMFNPTVQLPSGGYIVIGVTEALVAIDVNSGRATKEGSIEQTATKTNLEAAAEVARQLRLRDLAGLIVIDFIDMDERRNNTAVEKMMKDKLKTDRARIQVGRISGFGLMEMSRQRLRPGMIEATTQPCVACHGTGLIRSDDSLALSIIRHMEEEGTRRRTREVLIKAPVGIANFLMNAKREHVAQIEARYGMAVRIEGDPHLVSPDFSMEKFKTATRNVPVAGAHVVSVDTSLMDQIDEAEAKAAETAEALAIAEDEADENRSKSQNNGRDNNGEQQLDADGKPKRKRRRRRSRGGRGKNGGENANNENRSEEADQNAAQNDAAPADAAEADATTSETPQAEVSQNDVAVADGKVEAGADKPKKPTSRSRTRKPKVDPETAAEPAVVAEKSADADASASEPVAGTAAPEAEEVKEKPKPKPRKRATAASKKAKAAEDAATTGDAPEDAAPEAVKEPKPRKPRASRAKAKPKVEEKAADKAEVTVAPVAAAQEPTPPGPEPVLAPEPVAQTPAPEPVAEAPAPAPEPVKEEPKKPKRKGWWSLGR
ncbi:Rne/Rng family ribonuclease [Sulfitobacter sp. M57]|uniref:Rne/Rng family ribonuclease n=1 Tax=unclassified Sulfitobacter TaxID=196795 RepID=UPI0023E0A5DA|nr:MULTISPECIES: Rne/Rng family ribonuclease [unclassified Sulfitobacter]MDF3413588.1 Rne/Rng family ribonuclease [Sulfitobacter sp. KE5]MDF3421130.1 Rne/Rng family ribonuclease [Sulfitobacter sp. KE43]MDF3432135.1 Rne/Rng family ribonuclease [Sulfitobacter sp. KE42]MDF3457775.1 Rne/Rng family ribonuclease [Sulfitobacter sp. S74]MDF3461676.1 Rne/Rng family ribonuclease [Sulfitobacter sp. Ks18]